MREPLDETRKFWYSIAVEYADSGLQIFRHFMCHEESAKLWTYFFGLHEQGSVGAFSIIKDENTSPLPDAAIYASLTSEFMKTLAWLNPELETK